MLATFRGPFIGHRHQHVTNSAPAVPWNAHFGILSQHFLSLRFIVFRPFFLLFPFFWPPSPQVFHFTMVASCHNPTLEAISQESSTFLGISISVIQFHCVKQVLPYLSRHNYLIHFTWLILRDYPPRIFFNFIQFYRVPDVLPIF